MEQVEGKVEQVKGKEWERMEGERWKEEMEWGLQRQCTDEVRQ